MEFKQVQPDENYQVLKLQSEQWEIGLKLVTFGRYQVCVGRNHCNNYVLQYCCGYSRLFIELVYQRVKSILEYLPEEISSAKVQTLLPVFSRTKPLYKDADYKRLEVVYQKLKSGRTWDEIPQYDVVSTKLNEEEFEFSLVADKRVVGKISAILKNDSWWIMDIFLKPEYRRQGLGTYLLQASCQMMWEHNYSDCRIDICLEEFLKKWYVFMGFRVTNSCYFRQRGDYNYGIARSLNLD